MTDHDGFLQSIVGQPTEDLPRLVYADFLEENGQVERAELIRVQCRLSQIESSHPEWPRLHFQEQHLLDAYAAEWRIPKLRGQQIFQRGFVEYVGTTVPRLVQCDPNELTRSPIRSLRLFAVDQQINDLVNLSILQRIETLDLSNNTFGAQNRLRRFVAEVACPKLTTLILRNNRLWAEELQALANSPLANQLRHLDLAGNAIGREGLAVLTQSPSFAHLRHLNVRSDELPFVECLHADAADLLAQSGTLTQLRHLDLADHYLGDAGLIRLAQSANMQHLEELDLAYNEIGTISENGIEALVGSPYFQNLAVLSLNGNQMNSIAVELFLQWPQWKKLRSLSLQNIQMSWSSSLRMEAAMRDFPGVLLQPDIPEESPS